MARTFKPIQSGELRHVGNLEARIAGVDTAGSPTTHYTLFAENIRFAIADWKVTEVNNANQIISQIVTYIAIRYRPGVLPTMRLVHVTEATSPPLVDYYDIQGVVRDSTTRVALQLACIKRDATGFRIGTIP